MDSRTRALFAILVTALAGVVPARAAPTLAPGHPGGAGITYYTPQTPACDAIMAAQPTPDVTRILLTLA
jgi:hypothetical protein